MSNNFFYVRTVAGLALHKLISFFFLLYDQLFSSGSATGSSEGIYLVYSSWMTLVGLYIANYIAERSFE
jgi:hypothetical protein